MGASVLIGTTGCRGAFDEPLVAELARNSPAPIVMPLSNPGDRSEATAEQVLAWSGGRALVATGSPSADVEIGGRRRVIGQANNVFIFPGVGLGAIVAQAREVTDDAFLAAARELVGLVSAERLAAGALYPRIADLRVAARAVAITVVRELRNSGYGRQLADDEIEQAVEKQMWWPDYQPYVAA
jgi:malate dehydrogenase (oxaloacetate-decarboxylating)